MSIQLIEFHACGGGSPDSVDYTVWINPKAVLMVRHNSEGLATIFLTDGFVTVRESLSKVLSCLQGEGCT
jgi:hypothetical protein